MNGIAFRKGPGVSEDTWTGKPSCTGHSASLTAPILSNVAIVMTDRALINCAVKLCNSHALPINDSIEAFDTCWMFEGIVHQLASPSIRRVLLYPLPLQHYFSTTAWFTQKFELSGPCRCSHFQVETAGGQSVILCLCLLSPHGKQRFSSQ